MSMWDKMRCAVCGHWRIRHGSAHTKGNRTACRVSFCGCAAFEDPESS